MQPVDGTRGTTKSIRMCSKRAGEIFTDASGSWGVGYCLTAYTTVGPANESSFPRCDIWVNW